MSDKKKDIDIKKFQEKTETDIKHYGIFKTFFTKINETENELLKKKKEAYKDIQSIQEQDNVELKNIYSDFTRDMNTLEDYREKQIDKIKTKLIPSTTYYISKAKTDLNKIINHKEIKKDINNMKKELDKADEEGNDLKKSRISADIETTKHNAEKSGKDIQDNIVSFEKERIENNQLLLLHFIHNELAYHASSIETLSKLYYDIKSRETEGKSTFLSKLGKGNNKGEEQEEESEEEETNTKNRNKTSFKSSNVKTSGIGQSRRGQNLKKSAANEAIKENEEEGEEEEEDEEEEKEKKTEKDEV